MLLISGVISLIMIKASDSVENTDAACTPFLSLFTLVQVL